MPNTKSASFFIKAKGDVYDDIVIQVWFFLEPIGFSWYPKKCIFCFDFWRIRCYIIRLQPFSTNTKFTQIVTEQKFKNDESWQIQIKLMAVIKKLYMFLQLI